MGCIALQPAASWCTQNPITCLSHGYSSELQWPPPPRPTPIIVPSHLTATTEPSNPPPATSNAPTPEGSELGPSKSKGKSAGRSTMSSLQRAVLERLEVQKARNDLEGIVKKEPSS